MCVLQIFANTFPVHYSAPNGFGYEVNDDDYVPVQVLSLTLRTKLKVTLFIED